MQSPSSDFKIHNAGRENLRQTCQHIRPLSARVHASARTAQQGRNTTLTPLHSHNNTMASRMRHLSLRSTSRLSQLVQEAVGGAPLVSRRALLCRARQVSHRRARARRSGRRTAWRGAARSIVVGPVVGRVVRALPRPMPSAAALEAGVGRRAAARARGAARRRARWTRSRFDPLGKRCTVDPIRHVPFSIRGVPTARRGADRL